MSSLMKYDVKLRQTIGVASDYLYRVKHMSLNIHFTGTTEEEDDNNEQKYTRLFHFEMDPDRDGGVVAIGNFYYEVRYRLDVI